MFEFVCKAETFLFISVEKNVDKPDRESVGRVHVWFGLWSHSVARLSISDDWILVSVVKFDLVFFACFGIFSPQTFFCLSYQSCVDEI